MTAAKVVPKFSEFVALHRYYIWANRMRVHFDELLNEQEPRRPGWDIDSRTYMSYWYAGLYVVIEGWQELGLSDPAIDELLQSPNVALLRRFRNGVFHFQRIYDDERFIGLIRDGEMVVEWIRRLNEEFGRFCLSQSRDEWDKTRTKQADASTC